jgi:DNA-binding SARP family transcriptional activator
VRVRVLGDFAVTGSDGPVDIGGPRPRTLLALLIASAGSPVSNERLIDGIWGEDLPARPRKALQVMVANLRKALGPEMITTGPGGYRIDSNAMTVDASEFEQRARSATESNEFASALELWSGDPFPDLPRDGLREETTRLIELKCSVEERRAARFIELGAYEEAIVSLETMVLREPLRERRWELLMTALYGAGRQADALRAYSRARRVLAEELGVEPSPSLEDLEDRILQHDPSLQPRRSPAIRVNPYRGLLPFGVDDSHVFFGRDGFVARLMARVRSDPLVAVVGASGSGKSSLLSAGFIPAYRRQAAADRNGRTVVLMRPGKDPWRAAMNAARAAGGDGGPNRPDTRTLLPDGDWLLIVDQAEELFTSDLEASVAGAFLDELHRLVLDGRVRVILVVRADFWGRFLAHPAIGPMLVDGTLPLPPMSANELRQAIARPAERVGSSVEPALVEQTINDMAEEPGALPLLQFVLTELFAANSEVLGLDGYRRLGGLTGALAQRAEALHGNLTPGEQVALRQVLLHLVALGVGSRDTRRRMARAELESLHQDAGPLIDFLASRRLLALDQDPETGEATVDLAHEALIGGWSRFSRWIDLARDDLRRQTEVRHAAIEWERADRDDAFLLAAPRLARLDVRTANLVSLSKLEREFLDASDEKIGAEERAVAERQRRELVLARRARRRAWTAATVLAFGVGVSILLAVYAANLGREATAQRDEAQTQRDEAATQREVAEFTVAQLIGRQLPITALEIRRSDPELARLLAEEGIVAAIASGLSPSPAVTALHVVLQDLGERFPSDAEPVLVSTPEGRRGVFSIPVGQLLERSATHSTRSLTDEECATHLGRPCAISPPLSRLPAAAAEGSGLQRVGDFPPLNGTEIVIEVPNSDHFALWRIELRELIGDTLGVNTVIPAGSPSPAGPPDVMIAPYGTAPEPISLGGIVSLREMNGNVPVTLTDRTTNETGPTAVWVQIDAENLVFYRLDVFELLGLSIPRTWSELVAVTARLGDAGITPWCLGTAGPSLQLDGIVQARIVGIGGVASYNEWLRSPSVDDTAYAAALHDVAQLVHGNGGDPGVIRRTSSLEFSRFIATEPTCAMLPAASWEAVATRLDDERVAVFVAPGHDAEVSAPVIVGGSVAVMLTDRPETRALLRLLTTAPFGASIAAEREYRVVPANLRLTGGFPDPHRPVIRQALREAADAGMVLPGVLEDIRRYDAYRVGLTRLTLEGPDSVNEILDEMHAAWAELDD